MNDIPTPPAEETDGMLPAVTGSTHLTWSIERGHFCPSCGTPPVLISAPSEWHADSEQPEYEAATGDTTVADNYVTVDEEITGHWCPKCCRLLSLSLNS